MKWIFSQDLDGVVVPRYICCIKGQIIYKFIGGILSILSSEQRVVALNRLLLVKLIRISYPVAAGTYPEGRLHRGLGPRWEQLSLTEAPLCA